MRNLGRSKAIEVILFGVLLGLLACGKGTVPAVPSPVALPTTPLPSPTPSPRPTEPLPSPTPTPSPTPASPPLWRVYFRGFPCPDLMTCEEYEDTHVQSFFVNSDGSGLEAVKFSSTPGPEVVRFSADGFHLAYLDGTDIVLTKHDGTESVRFALKDGYRVDFDFIGDDCLALYRFSDPGGVDRICVGDPEPQILVREAFPDLRCGFSLISPEGSKLLGYTIGSLHCGGVYIYMKLLGSDDPPSLLFHSPESCEHSGLTSIRWLSDEVIEFLWNCWRGRSESFFQQVDWQGRNLITLLKIQDVGIGPGDWSPDGREFVFYASPAEGGPPMGEEAGLYILNLVTGERRKIVSEMGIIEIIVFPVGNIEHK